MLGVWRAPQTRHVRRYQRRLRALLFAGLGHFHGRQVDLAVVVAAEVRQVGLGAVRRALPHVAHLQRAPPQRPLVPLIVHVQVLLHEMGRGLGAGVSRARQEAPVAAFWVEGPQAARGRSASAAVAVSNQLRNGGVGKLVLEHTKENAKEAAESRANDWFFQAYNAFL